MSHNDTKRLVHIPTTLTVELAEFIGIVVGDGHLEYYKGKHGNGIKYVLYQIRIACNMKEGLFIAYIRNLFFSLFGIWLSYIDDTARGSITLSKNSKAILTFFHTTCEIPLNSKTAIVRIPTIIKDSAIVVKCAFLRGLADTDFAVSFKNRTNKGHNYPVIRGSFKSRLLVEDLSVLFNELGFTFCLCYSEKRYDKRNKKYDGINSIYLNGKGNFRRWLSLVGFSNPKFQDKVKKWQTDGVCPPYYEKAPAEIRTRGLLLSRF